MTILVDTTILVDVLRTHEPARAALSEASRAGERVSGSILTKVEVLAGMLPPEEDRTRELLGGVEWIGIDDAVAERAATLARSFLRSHRGIELVDYVVAATAQLLDAELWTRNRKHFPMFPVLAEPY